MSYPCIYNEEGKCKLHSTVYEHSWCVEGPCDSQTLSNGDRIRSMTDEELAEFIAGNADDEYVSNEEGFELVNWRYFPVDYKHRGETAQENVLYWLKQPAEIPEQEISKERR